MPKAIPLHGLLNCLFVGNFHLLFLRSLCNIIVCALIYIVFDKQAKLSFIITCGVKK